MKNKQEKIYFKLFYYFLLLISFVSCKKQQNFNSSFNRPISFTSKTEAKSYINSQLNTYAIIFTELSKRNDIKSIVHDEVSKHFDGDNNVLIKTIFEKCEERGINLKEITQSILEQKRLNITTNELLGSLNNINNKNFYPHIYIPNFERFNSSTELMSLKDNNKGLSSTNNVNKKISFVYSDYSDFYPTVVPYDGDETIVQEYYTGYLYNNYSQETEIVNVNEEYTEDNEVWIITLNESVDQSGLPNTTSGSAGSPSNNQRPDLYIPNMTIKEHKESWLKGASEVCMYAGISWDNGINPNTGAYQTSFRTRAGLVSLTDRNNDVNNIEIRKFLRDEVKYKRSVNINFTYFPLSSEVFSSKDPCYYLLQRADKTPTENAVAYGKCKEQTPDLVTYFYPEKGDYLYYVIYEYDTGFLDLNSGYDYIQIQGNNFNQKIYYQSNESPYYSGRLKILPKDQPTQAYQNTGWADINDSSIIFNSRHR